MAVAIALAVTLATYAALGYGEGVRFEGGSRSAYRAAVVQGGGGATPVSVSVDPSHRGRQVPPGFLGLSFEASSLQRIALYSGGGNLVRLLRSLGTGVLRFGGVSADTRVAWTNPVTPPPPWASWVISSTDLRRLAKLASDSGWRVLLTIGLVHFDPVAAAAEATAARVALGSSLVGIELGNEPDAYMRHALRVAPWTFAQYAQQAHAYRRAIAAHAPGLALAGPDVSGSAVFQRWGSREASQLRPRLLTGHHYPLGCHQVPAPSIERLLSFETRRAEEISLSRYMHVARSRGIRFRIDETNSVSCGGTAGISDTFASALWAVSYIARSMAAGVAGMNFHGDPANCRGYAPLCAPTPQRLQAGVLSARPEWYSLLLARALIGDRVVRTRVGWPGPPGEPRANLSVTTLRAPDGRLHLVIVDEDPPGAAPVLMQLHVGPRYGRATLLALTGPSLTASFGVKLGGRSVTADGSWSPPRALPVAVKQGRVISFEVAPSSAMLATVLPTRPLR